MKFKGRFTAPRIDLSKFRQAMHRRLLDALTFAASEWLNATADQIPQWSGASAATFLHLARAVGYTLPISKSSTARVDGKAIGLSQSTGDFTADPGSGRYQFSYSTTLKRLIFNEFNNANVTEDPNVFYRLLQPGPYRFQERGREAFLRAIAGVTLPDPFDNLKRTLIRIK